MPTVKVPNFDDMMNPTLQAIRDLGGSGTIEEINTKVAELMTLTDEQMELLHDPSKGGMTEIEYRLAWTRTYLRRYGLLENSARGIWALTPESANAGHVDEREVVRVVRAQLKAEKEARASEESEDTEAEPSWRDHLLETLLEMKPDAFERLVQRLLRESGFVQVEVTGRSGDGGIDGKGILRIGGLLSFHVIFQCKRWQAPVRPTHIRDFRGAMMGRADKGLFISTGTFTQEALREATRDGATPIDLIDGDQLVDKLKDLGLGVRAKKIEVEEVTIDRDWLLGV